MRRHMLWALLLVTTPVAAQTPTPPTSAEVLVLPPGSDPATATPIATRTTPISATTNCGITTPPPAGPTPLVNPTKAVFDDPFTPGRYCMIDMPTGLPTGTGYIAVARAVNTAGPGPRSAAGIPLFNISPTSNPPAVLTNLVVRP